MQGSDLSLVTGAAGFIGANLVRRLLDSGRSVVALLRPQTDPWRLPSADECRSMRIVRELLASPLDNVAVRNIGAVRSVFHVAGAAVNQASVDVRGMIAGNVMATYAALDLATRTGAERFVYVGSSGEYGPCEMAREDQLPAPNSEYGATKLAGWMLARAYGTRTGLAVTGVRPFSVFGPFEAGYRLVPYCMLRAMDGIAIDATEGLQTRDYVYVDDVVSGIIAAAEAPGAVGRTFNLCTGTSTRVRDMVDSIVRVCESCTRPNYGARPANATEMWRTSGDATLAGQVLGWSSRHSLDDGLRATREWMLLNRAKYARYYSA